MVKDGVKISKGSTVKEEWAEKVQHSIYQEIKLIFRNWYGKYALIMLLQ